MECAGQFESLSFGNKTNKIEKGGERNLKMCPDCAKRGIVSRVKLFQINYEEAVYLCQTKNCLFPLTSDPATLIVKRKSTVLATRRKSKKNRTSNENPVETPVAETVGTSTFYDDLDLDLLLNGSQPAGPSREIEDSEISALAAMLDLDASEAVNECGFLDTLSSSASVHDRAAAFPNEQVSGDVIAESFSVPYPCPVESSSTKINHNEPIENNKTVLLDPDLVNSFSTLTYSEPTENNEIGLLNSNLVENHALINYSKTTDNNEIGVLGIEESPCEMDASKGIDPICGLLDTSPTPNISKENARVSSQMEESSQYSASKDLLKSGCGADSLTQQLTVEHGCDVMKDIPSEKTVLMPVSSLPQNQSPCKSKEIGHQGESGCNSNSISLPEAKQPIPSQTQSIAKPLTTTDDIRSVLPITDSHPNVNIQLSRLVRQSALQKSSSRKLIPVIRPLNLTGINQPTCLVNAGSSQARIFLLPLTASGQAGPIYLNLQQATVVKQQLASVVDETRSSCVKTTNPVSNTIPSIANPASTGASGKNQAAVPARRRKTGTSRRKMPAVIKTADATSSSQQNTSKSSEGCENGSINIFSFLSSEEDSKPKQSKKAPVSRKKAVNDNKVVPRMPQAAADSRVSRWIKGSQQTPTLKQFPGYIPKSKRNAVVKERLNTAGCLSDDSGIQSPMSGQSEESLGPRQLQ